MNMMIGFGILIGIVMMVAGMTRTSEGDEVAVEKGEEKEEGERT